MFFVEAVALILDRNKRITDEMSLAEKLKLLKRKAEVLAPAPPQPVPEPARETAEDRLRARLEAGGPRLMREVEAEEAAHAAGHAAGQGVSGDGGGGDEVCIALLFLVRSNLPHEAIWR